MCMKKIPYQHSIQSSEMTFGVFSNHAIDPHMSQKNNKRIIIIFGPTASGKSARAIDLAKEHNGVIINADSMQIYDDLPILTARPSPEEEQLVPHRLYGSLPVHEKCTAARWRDLAMDEIECAFQNGQTPLIVGGTGFYIKTLTDGLTPIPDVPDNIHEQACAKHEECGNPAFHDFLAKEDPAMAERLDPHDSHRLIRAYGVLMATGKSLSYWQEQPLEGPPSDWHFEYEIILPPRDVLRDKINRRLDIMMDMGAMDEIIALSRKIDDGDVCETVPITKAHGFRPFRAYLKGEMSYEDALERTKAEIRQYAKRQTTWIRHQLPENVLK